jgi:CMP-N,N'-diacetyllegionaminic acid synthase
MRLCTICARGGSRGVPNKNLRSLLGKPLIAHSILQARESGLFDIIAVSSDSDDILAAAAQWGANQLIKRPAVLAADTAAKVPAIRHCVEEVERLVQKSFNLFVDLDATSPLRLTADISGAVAMHIEKNALTVLTGAPARRSPYFNLVETDAFGVVRLSKQLAHAVSRRQDAPPCFDLNASVYVWSREGLFGAEPLFNARTYLYEMPSERSVDIDHEIDFDIVELLMKQRAAGG